MRLPRKKYIVRKNRLQNGALCFVVDDSYQCYCVPDYHGHHCQYKYNDCLLPPFPK
jgi:hypothetical protein